jgi:hypothetical protein
MFLRRPCLLVLSISLLVACATTPTLEPAALGERRPPNEALIEGCAEQTARTLQAFEEALAAGWRSYEPLCQLVGPPDWETGSGLSILIYELEDDSEVWLRYGGTDLMGAEWHGDGQTVDLLAEENDV